MNFVMRLIWRAYVDAAVICVTLKCCDWTVDTYKQWKEGRSIAKPGPLTNIRSRAKRAVLEQRKRFDEAIKNRAEKIPSVEEQLDEMSCS